MPREKSQQPGSAGRTSLYSAAIETLSLGVVVVVSRGKKTRIKFANRQLGELLDLDVTALAGQEVDAFWDHLCARLGNPVAVREDLERLAANPRESRADVLHLVSPEPLALERTTAPLLAADGRVRGRVWTFRNATREFTVREELQRKRKTEYCFRTLSSFLFEASLSRDSLSEVCRIAALGLDVPSVVFVPFQCADIRTPVQFATTRRFRLNDRAAAVARFVTRRARDLENNEVLVLPMAEVGRKDSPPFMERKIDSLQLVPVGCEERRCGYILVEETRRRRAWGDEERRTLQGVARAAGMWLLKEEHERNLIRAREEAEAAARVRSDFIALLSHELRTPLNPLIGFTQLLEELSDRMPEEARDMVSRIAQGAMRLRELVEDLLTLTRLDSRLEGWRKYHCDPRGIVEDSCNWVARLVSEKELQVELEIGTDLGIVEADGAALRRAINAMLSNAVRFSPNQGIIRVRAHSNDHFFHVEISDQGPGVADESKRKIFEPFVQGEPVLTRRHGGAGIGLTLVRKVADSHDGHVWVEDAPGGGSVFHLQLPRAELDSSG